MCWTIRGSNSVWGKRDVFSEISGTCSGPRPGLTQWASGAFSPKVEQHWRDADRLLPCTAEVKNEWWCTFSPTIFLHGVYGDNFASVPLA